MKVLVLVLPRGTELHAVPDANVLPRCGVQEERVPDRRGGTPASTSDDRASPEWQAGRSPTSLRRDEGAAAGFYLIEARDLNDAIQVAAKIPPAARGKR